MSSPAKRHWHRNVHGPGSAAVTASVAHRLGPRRLLAWLLSVGLLLATVVPRASAGPPTTRRLAAKAAELFREGRYLEAAKYYLAVRRGSDLPIVDWNIARCYEEAGQTGLAIQHLRLVVADPRTSGELRDATDARLARLMRRVVPEPMPNRPRRSPAALPPAITLTPVYEAPDRTGPWTLIGVGGAALAVGALTTALAFDADQALRDGFTTVTGADGRTVTVETLTPEERSDLEATRDANTIAMGIAWGVGGALVISGIIWMVVDDEPAVVPTLVPTAGGARFGLSAGF